MQRERKYAKSRYFFSDVNLTPTSHTPERELPDIICDRRNIRVSVGNASITTSLLPL